MRRYLSFLIAAALLMGLLSFSGCRQPDFGKPKYDPSVSAGGSGTPGAPGRKGAVGPPPP